MGFPTVEIVYCKGTDAVINDPHGRDVVQGAFSILQEQDGMHKIYYGVQHEDKKTTYHVIAWETYNDHKKLMENTVIYPKLRAAAALAFDISTDVPQMYHVKPTGDPYKALDAPALEIAVFTLNEGQDKAALQSILNALVASFQGAPGFIHATWGPIVEKDNVLVGLLGWTTVQAHWDRVKTDPKAIELIGNIKEIASIDLVHVPLVAY